MISKEAIDLVKLMLKYDPEAWISAKDALNHPWIKIQTDLLAKPDAKDQ